MGANVEMAEAERALLEHRHAVRVNLPVAVDYAARTLARAVGVASTRAWTRPARSWRPSPPSPHGPGASRPGRGRDRRAGAHRRRPGRVPTLARTPSGAGPCGSPASKERARAAVAQGARGPSSGRDTPGHPAGLLEAVWPVPASLPLGRRERKPGHAEAPHRAHWPGGRFGGRVQADEGDDLAAHAGRA